MSIHLTLRTNLQGRVAAAGLALALHACADAAPHEDPGTTAEPGATTRDPAPGHSEAAASPDAANGPSGQVLDGVPLGQPVDPPPPPPPPVVEPPSPQGPKVEVVRANGTGCPRGEWRAELAPSGDIELAIDGFAARLEAGAGAVAVRDCQLALSIDPGAGKSFAVESIAYHGRATLSATTRAELTVKHYFQGDPTPGDEMRAFSGPFDADYVFMDEVAPEAASWSPCGGGRNLNLQTTLRVMGGGDTTTSSLSLGAIKGLRLALRACSDGEADPADEDPPPAKTDGPHVHSVTRL